MPELKLKLDTSHFNTQLQLLNDAIENASPETLAKVRDLFFSTPDFLEKLFRLEIDPSTAGTIKVVCLLNQTNFFGMFLLAIGTGDFDSLAVEN